jgi:hypothetical protein
MISGDAALVVDNPTSGQGMASIANTRYHTGRSGQICMGKASCMAMCMEELHSELWMLKRMGRERRRVTNCIHTHAQALQERGRGLQGQ